MRVPRFRQQQACAWLATFAMLLLSIVPTISQVAAAYAPHDDHALASGRAHADAAHHAHGPGASGKDHDECWRKCGYCDFLTHTPALGTFAYNPALAPAHAPAPASAEIEQPRYAKPVRAAQPRGPPVLIA